MKQNNKMRTYLGVALIALLALALTAACAPPASLPASGIQASEVWARAAKAGEMKSDASSDTGMAMGSMNSAVYMLLTNSGDSPDRLISAAADVAGAVEIHESIMDGDMMRMQQVPGGIEIPANGQVELKPGGLHVMLIDLTRDLNPGETFPVTLQFEQAGAVTVEAEVRQP
ncbi:MAG: copper chaperone PCu(A)C [Anaerolineae bacterium]|nr:copper chaperone PCu(A)C [Anaerolineae bacterium]